MCIHILHRLDEATFLKVHGHVRMKYVCLSFHMHVAHIGQYMCAYKHTVTPTFYHVLLNFVLW